MLVRWTALSNYARGKSITVTVGAVAMSLTLGGCSQSADKLEETQTNFQWIKDNAKYCARPATGDCDDYMDRVHELAENVNTEDGSHVNLMKFATEDTENYKKYCTENKMKKESENYCNSVIQNYKGPKYLQYAASAYAVYKVRAEKKAAEEKERSEGTEHFGKKMDALLERVEKLERGLRPELGRVPFSRG